jgi:hypothetical protein
MEQMDIVEVVEVVEVALRMLPLVRVVLAETVM